MVQADAAPTKIILERRVRPGAQPKFREWVKSLMQTTSQYAGLQGSSVITSASGDEVFILLRFASHAHLEQWHAAPEVRALLDEGKSLATEPEAVQVRSGLETWFTLPGVPPPATAPARWKMALVTWLALLPQVIVLSLVIPAALPLLLKVAVSTAIPVAMLTWLIMPRLTKLLYRWLYPAAAPPSGDLGASPGASELGRT